MSSSTRSAATSTLSAATPTLTAATQTLLRRFRSQRPVRGGSLLITIFGDGIAPRGGVVTLGSLISLARPFGLTERLVRTSVGRLAADGWLVARREGRQSEYRLTPTGEERFAEATARIYGENPRDWDRQWTLLILPPGHGGHNGTRSANTREALRWLGFGQLGPGLFAHPSCTLEQARSWTKEVDGAGKALLLRSSGESVAVDRQLVATGWDLGELARRYQRFVDTFAPVGTAVQSARLEGANAESAFVVRTLLIHEYRKIHLRDPLLPPALLPDGWVGTAAYELCRRLYPAVFAEAERFLSEHASSIRAPLPPPDAAVHKRFMT
jgi:phenylacetic acid degradation operon negative regulatory protein